ncbi:MAG: terpene cyclase/mutase family protein [Pirellulales bacterium]|nr:terpene cyclase/mutase family protein [Pirellulales bacterium]
MAIEPSGSSSSTRLDETTARRTQPNAKPDVEGNTAAAAQNPSTTSKPAGGKTRILQAKADPTLVRAKPLTSTSAAAPQGATASKPAGGGEQPQAASTASQPQQDGKAKQKTKPAAWEELEQLDQYGSLSFMQVAPAALVSIVVHIVLVLILGLILLPEPAKDTLRQLVSRPLDQTQQEVLDNLPDLPEEIPLDVTTEATELVQTESASDTVAPEVSELVDALPAMAAVPLSDVGLDHAPAVDLAERIGAFEGTGLGGRGAAQRKALVATGGGTEESEAAVARALEWLARHQLPDGSWSFDHRQGLCQGRCKNPGNLAQAHLAATGMALLPFLGAGQTHKEGKYKKNVELGLYYIINNMRPTPNGGDMTAGGGAMYGHGICSIALCEAYAMTQDRGLLQPCMAALAFINYAQDDVGGGWRYSPNEAGDTSVVGWQLMALKSGHMAYLQIDPRVIKGAENFLNTVQSDGGATYGYTTPGAGQATTAIGLLCRMYLGWKRDNPALERGVQLLSNWGPAPGAYYYNYYATQVMHHYGGELWEKWNAVMRDSLVNSQVQGDPKENDAVGSWFTEGGDHGAASGGRLYCTAMATMVLEVYYRHLPLYKSQSTEDEFEE